MERSAEISKIPGVKKLNNVISVDKSGATGGQASKGVRNITVEVMVEMMVLMVLMVMIGNRIDQVLGASILGRGRTQLLLSTQVDIILRNGSFVAESTQWKFKSTMRA